MKVLFLTNIPSPYRVDFFNELGKYCELTVLFEKDNSSERDKSWGRYIFTTFKGIFLKSMDFGVDNALSLEVVKYLKKDIYDYIIVSNFSTPTGIIAIEYMRLNKIPYVLESDGGFPKGSRGVKERVKKHIIKGAKLYFSTAKMHDLYYVKYGADPNNIVRYPFTSIYKKDILKQPLKESEKKVLKNKIGMKEEKVILAIGQFIERKGFDVLLKAARSIYKGVGIYIVGGEPTPDYLKIMHEMNINNVYFVGFKEKRELRDFYLASDLFVLPTREDIWGLVINEAMASGLPVITTNKCIAGLELVENYKNGFIVPVDNEQELGDKINIVFENEKMLKSMSDESLNKIRNYTIENMSQKHIEIFNQVIERDM